jgi:hypothetical protein
MSISIHPLPHATSWFGASLVKDRDILSYSPHSKYYLKIYTCAIRKNVGCISFCILANPPYTFRLMDYKFVIFQLRKEYIEEGNCFADSLVPVYMTYT